MTQNRKQLILFLLITLLLLGTLLASLLAFSIQDPAILVSSVVGTLLAFIVGGWLSKKYFVEQPSLSLTFTQAKIAKLHTLLEPQAIQTKAPEDLAKRKKEEEEVRQDQLGIGQIYNQHKQYRKKLGFPIPDFKAYFESILSNPHKEEQVRSDYSSRADYYRIINGKSVTVTAETRFDKPPEGRGLKSIQPIQEAFRKHMQGSRWADFLYNRIQQNFGISAGQLQQLFIINEIYLAVEHHFLEFSLNTNQSHICDIAHGFSLKISSNLYSKKNPPPFKNPINVVISFTASLSEQGECTIAAGTLKVLSGEKQKIRLVKEFLDQMETIPLTPKRNPKKNTKPIRVDKFIQEYFPPVFHHHYGPLEQTKTPRP